MKKMFMSMLIFLICMFGVIGYVKADTSKCTVQMQTELTRSVSQVTASYEFVYDENNNVRGFDIKVYNIPDNMNVLYSISGKNSKNGNFIIENGTGKIFDNNLNDIYTYNIGIYSLNEGCNYKVKTLNVVKPKRNSYSDLVYCLYEENEKSPYCKEWITNDIKMSQSEVEKLLNSNLKKFKTTEATSVCVDCGAEGIAYSLKGFYNKYKYTIIIATLLVISLNIFAIVLLIKSGEGGVI